VDGVKKRFVRGRWQVALGLNVVGNIIVKKVSGELNHERVMRLVRETAVDAASHPDRNILIDYRETTVADKSMLDIMKISSEIKSYQFFFTNRVATVVSPEKTRHEIASKMKACLVIMGFQYEVFTDYDDALTWLDKS
jgi:hypothetical protein